jgi:phosphate acetyltransferase
MFENLVEVLKANPRKIVYTEGTDARILESAARLKQGGFLTPILVGNVDDVKAAAKAGNFDIEGLEIIDPANYDKMDEMAQCMFDLRKGKMTMEEVRANLQKGNYFGTMLVKMGVADALLGGATYSTADTVRPALQLIKTKKGAHLVSSCFIMVRGDEMLAMGDCAINIDYQDTVDKATGEVTFSAAQKLAEGDGRSRLYMRVWARDLKAEGFAKKCRFRKAETAPVEVLPGTTLDITTWEKLWR